jgi:hypothetical protein
LLIHLKKGRFKGFMDSPSGAQGQGVAA